ncbi:ubiquitin carboxyl-terminal hydrolase 20-like [Solanum dulcamara]|uniref:ubiquitin carboxyl-terminal hydrolase 20-like n=1 Tax=Solanum dulcamara TaxID=45834 RepID=UPI002484FDC2|nr:ubiquitin carboxyl-terminal hydrolase 20-like [Solanum dulcamara]
MKTLCSETPVTGSKPVALVSSDETLDGSSPISDDDGNLPSSENPANSIESEELCMEEEELDASPVRTYSAPYYCSRWAQPWGKITNSKPLYSQPAAAEPEDEPSPENEPSPFDWTDGSSESKVEPNKSVPVELQWNSYRDEEAKCLLGAGLANLGNTCYLNAVLQSFMHTVPLIQGLKSIDHTTPCNSYLKGFCVICALRKLIDASLFSEAGVVSPWKFVNNLNYFSSTFHRFQQEDAHEFLQCFLDKLERCCDDSRPKDCQTLETDNIVKQAFGGRLVSKLRCCNCGHCSDTYETLIDLSLEIEDVDSVDTALESFTKVEKIEDSETKFTCEKCKEQVSIEKQLVLDKAPSVAALHLKRFKTDGSIVEKIDKYVSFPLELDLHTYADNNQVDNEEMKYDLYAVIVHIGFSYCSGHYYSFIRSAPNEWYKFDDSKVVHVREDYVLSQEAYVLFYAKRGTPWFSDFIEGQKPFIDPSIRSTSPKSVLENTDAVCVPSPLLPNAQAFDVKESNDAANESSPNSLNKVQDSEGKENVQMMSTPRPPLGASNILYSKSREVDKVSSPSVLKDVSKPISRVSVLKESCSTLDPGSTSRTLYITPETPPRSPSPEIYREDPPDNDYHIPCGHLRTVGQVSCKKQLQKDLEQDMERKQACSLIKKNMPGSRAQQLLAAVQGSCSEGSANKKRRRRMEVSPTRDDTNSTSRRRSSIGSTMRTVMAGSMR